MTKTIKIMIKFFKVGFYVVCNKANLDQPFTGTMQSLKKKLRNNEIFKKQCFYHLEILQLQSPALQLFMHF